MPERNSYVFPSEASIGFRSAVSCRARRGRETCSGRYHSSSSFELIVQPSSFHQWQVFQIDSSRIGPSKFSSKIICGPAGLEEALGLGAAGLVGLLVLVGLVARVGSLEPAGPPEAGRLVTV